MLHKVLTSQMARLINGGVQVCPHNVSQQVFVFVRSRVAFARFIRTSVHPSKFHHCLSYSQGRGGDRAFPGYLGTMVGYNLDEMPQTDNFELPINLTCISLDFGR